MFGGFHPDDYFAWTVAVIVLAIVLLF